MKLVVHVPSIHTSRVGREMFRVKFKFREGSENTAVVHVSTLPFSYFLEGPHFTEI